MKNLVTILFALTLASCGGGSSSGGPSKNVTAECLKTSTKAAGNGIPLTRVTLENKCDFAISAGFVSITFQGPTELGPKQTKEGSGITEPTEYIACRSPSVAEGSDFPVSIGCS